MCVSLSVCVCRQSAHDFWLPVWNCHWAHGRSAVAGWQQEGEGWGVGFSLGRRRCAFTFLISTLAALQRGICVSFMCGFSAGYDAVTIATLSPWPLSPLLPLSSCSSHPGGCSPLFRAQCKEVSIVFCSNVCHASSQFTVGCINKWAL